MTTCIECGEEGGMSYYPDSVGFMSYWDDPDDEQLRMWCPRCQEETEGVETVHGIWRWTCGECGHMVDLEDE